MEVAGNTPVLVSASQVVDRLDENWEKLGPADMAAKAVSEMLASTAVADIGSYVDRVMVMRTFVDSVPDRLNRCSRPSDLAPSLLAQSRLEQVSTMPPHTTPRLEVRAPSNTRLGLAVRLPAVKHARSFSAVQKLSAPCVPTNAQAKPWIGQRTQWVISLMTGWVWRINSYQP